MSEKKIIKLKRKVEILENMLEDKTRSLFIAKEEVERTSHFINTIINSMSEMILSIDPSGKIELANDAANAKLTENDPLLGKHIRDVLGNEIVDSLINDDTKYGQGEVKLKGKQGIQFYALVSRRAFKTKDSLKNGYVYSIVDITSLKNKEKIIKKQHFQLVQNTQLASLGEMARGIAHEINNPVTIMEGQLRRLKEFLSDSTKSNKDKVELTDKIHLNLARVVNIISSIKKISSRGSEDNITILNITDIFNSLKNLCSENFRHNGVDITFNHTENFSTLFANETQLLQVLMSLIINSNDAVILNEKKWIRVEATCDDKNIHLRVIDSGNGIPRKVLEKMFNPFFTTKDVNKGTGIGLSISKKMIENQNGTLNYELYNNNTSFLISLKKDQ